MGACLHCGSSSGWPGCQTVGQGSPKSRTRQRIAKAVSRIAAPVVEVGSTAVPADHLMVHLVLGDGRELLVSPGHRTADGRALGSLSVGEQLDGSRITLWELVPYAGARTYDLLPAGPTGHYWANGVLLASTLA